MISDQSHPTNEQPLQPEIPRSRFALGMTKRERALEELRLGQFSDGQQTLPESAHEAHRGRFSEGVEVLGEDDPQKHIRRRFSQGLETPPRRS